MKLFRLFTLTALYSITLNTPLLAEDNPDEVLQSAVVTTAEKNKQSLQNKWKGFVENQNWGDSEFAEGVMHFPERELIISSGTAFISVGKGQPGWIESRITAFESAELDAKAKIIRFLSESIETSRAFNYMENASWSDGSIEEIQQLGEVESTLRSIGKKSLALANSSLDQALSKLDPDYSPEKYETSSSEQKKTIVDQQFKRKLKTLSFKTTVGITPVFNAEGETEGQYSVMVGLAWSPKLNKLATSLDNQQYTIKPMGPGTAIDEWLPEEKQNLMGTWGTRIIVDEKGEYVVLALAQAAPRNTSPNRKASATQDAKEIAANRARAMIVNFVKETLSLENSEESQELLREFSDSSVGTETVRKVSEKIKGSKAQIKLKGLRVLREWSAEHPETGQQVTGTVVAWSPTAKRVSESMQQSMESKRKTPTNPEADSESSTTSEPIHEAMPVDTSVY